MGAVTRRDIRVRLTLPDTSLTIGGFEIDIVKQATGLSIKEALGSLIVGEVEREYVPNRCITYPLSIPENEGASFPVGSYGELGFLNMQGRLVLTVPRVVWPGVQKAFGDAVESARDVEPSSVQARILLTPGMKRRADLGTFGVIGIEAI